MKWVLHAVLFSCKSKAFLIGMVSYVTSLWNRGTRELGNGLSESWCDKTNAKVVYSFWGQSNGLMWSNKNRSRCTYLLILNSFFSKYIQRLDVTRNTFDYPWLLRFVWSTFLCFPLARESRHTSMRSVLSFPAICVDHVHYRLIWRASRRCLLRQCILQDLPRGNLFLSYIVLRVCVTFCLMHLYWHWAARFLL